MAFNDREPTFAKVIEQFPTPATKTPAQDSPVLAATETLPVGEPLPPVTLKLTSTARPGTDGFGVLEVMEVALAAFVVCEKLAATVQAAVIGAVA